MWVSASASIVLPPWPECNSFGSGIPFLSDSDPEQLLSETSLVNCKVQHQACGSNALLLQPYTYLR